MSALIRAIPSPVTVVILYMESSAGMATVDVFHAVVCVFVCLVTVVLCSTGSTNKRCAWEGGLLHTRHAVSVCVCVCVSVCLSCICLLNSTSVPVREECAKPDNPGRLVQLGPAFPRGQSSSGLAGDRGEPASDLCP